MNKRFDLKAVITALVWASMSVGCTDDDHVTTPVKPDSGINIEDLDTSCSAL